MRQDRISLRRRQLVIAGLVSVVAPAGVFAAQFGGASGAAELSRNSGELIVSGRVIGPDGKPLAGAAVAAWQSGASEMRASATTDADGRFVLARTACAEHGGRPQSLSYRVSHPQHQALQTRLDFARTQLQRDEAGIWRAAIGITLG